MGNPNVLLSLSRFLNKFGSAKRKPLKCNASGKSAGLVMMAFTGVQNQSPILACVPSDKANDCKADRLVLSDMLSTAHIIRRSNKLEAYVTQRVSGVQTP